MSTRRRFTASFKTKLVLEALKERYTIQELGRKHGIHPQQITTWKGQFLENAESVFEKGKEKKAGSTEEKLFKVIGQLKVENDLLRTALS